MVQIAGENYTQYDNLNLTGELRIAGLPVGVGAKNWAKFFDGVGGQDINTPALTPINFANNDNPAQDIVTQVNPSFYTVNKTGFYFIQYSVPWQTSNNQRRNVRTEIRFAGITGDRGLAYGYARNNANPFATNAAIEGAANIPAGLSFEIVGSQSGGSGNAPAVPGGELLFVYAGQ